MRKQLLKYKLQRTYEQLKRDALNDTRYGFGMRVHLKDELPSKLSSIKHLVTKIGSKSSGNDYVINKWNITLYGKLDDSKKLNQFLLRYLVGEGVIEKEVLDEVMKHEKENR